MFVLGGIGYFWTGKGGTEGELDPAEKGIISRSVCHIVTLGLPYKVYLDLQQLNN